MNGDRRMFTTPYLAFLSSPSRIQAFARVITSSMLKELEDVDDGDMVDGDFDDDDDDDPPKTKSILSRVMVTHPSHKRKTLYGDILLIYLIH